MVVPVPDDDDRSTHNEVGADSGQRYSWAKMMARVFDIDVTKCPKCESPMQRIAFITTSDAIRKILDSVGLPADSPTPMGAAFEQHEMDWAS